jgi:hypothetical protein
MKYYEVIMEASGTGRIFLYADDEEGAKTKVKEMYENGQYQFDCPQLSILSTQHITKTGCPIDPDRICNNCNKKMDQGYCIFGGEEYYCTDACLRTRFTAEEWEALYSDDGDCYWTEWK